MITTTLKEQTVVIVKILPSRNHVDHRITIGILRVELRMQLYSVMFTIISELRDAVSLYPKRIPEVESGSKASKTLMLSITPYPQIQVIFYRQNVPVNKTLPRFPESEYQIRTDVASFRGWSASPLH